MERSITAGEILDQGIITEVNLLKLIWQGELIKPDHSSGGLDIEGWRKPDTIQGVRPDIMAEKGGHRTAIEVETNDSVNSKRDLQQQKAFKNWSKEIASKHYKRVVTGK